MNSNENKLCSDSIEKLSRTAEILYQTTQDQATQASNLREQAIAAQCLQELRTALNELKAVHNALKQQNQMLCSENEALEAEYRQYHELFELAPEGYVVTDLKGKILKVNQAAIALFNAPSEYLMGRSLITHVAYAQQQVFQALLDAIPAFDRVQEWEGEFYRAGDQRSDGSIGDGTLFDGALSVTVVRDRQQCPIALRWLLRDVTARKVAEAQMHQIELQNLSLVESDRLRSQFLSILSHELRTPMNAILGFSELLLRKFHNQQDVQLASMIEKIFRNGRHLLMLIEEMLDFSRLKTECLQLHPEPFDLAELAREVTQELQPLAVRKLLTLQFNLAQPCIIVQHDRLRLQQIITNLLSNAIKFTERGTVTVDVCTLPESRVLIVVRDTGIGIAAADQEQVFQEFWQVNQSTTRYHSGTGLGLAITRALVHLMHGSITLESKLGQGSVFRVELPQQLS